MAGQIAPLILSWMIWRTLKIPHTMAATGLFYIALLGFLSARYWAGRFSRSLRCHFNLRAEIVRRLTIGFNLSHAQAGRSPTQVVANLFANPQIKR